MKTDQVNSKSSVNIQSFFKKMDAFLSFIPSSTFVQNVAPIRSTVSPEIVPKGQEEHSW